MKFIVTYLPGQADDSRPWGGWRTVAVGHLGEQDNALAFCDKIITINSGQSLSIQKHLYRQEDWTVYEGELTVFLGESPDSLRPHILTSGKSIHIPRHVWHRAENKGAVPAVFTERQSGIYLDERDIIRYPTEKDPRGTDEAALAAVQADVAARGLKWP